MSIRDKLRIMAQMDEVNKLIRRRAAETASRVVYPRAWM